MTPRSAVFVYLCVFLRSCLPWGMKGGGLKCQDLNTPDTQTKKYMCGLSKHKKRANASEAYRLDPALTHFHTNTQRHMFTYEAINKNFQSETKVFLVQPPCQPRSHLKTTMLLHLSISSRVDFLRCNPSSGVSSDLAVVHFCLTGMRCLCDTCMHQEPGVLFRSRFSFSGIIIIIRLWKLECFGVFNHKRQIKELRISQPLISLR